ncbi:alpha/beta fold hydrolase [Rhodoferax sp.]|uniref:alpha/beta fold hydrolase n=1 Tax=Rhodoferax sp. TaxID=50421 RepID=UPI00374DC8BA
MVRAFSLPLLSLAAASTPPEPSPPQPPRRRTTVLRSTLGKSSPFLKPSARFTVGPAPVAPVEVAPPPAPLVSVSELRQRITPARRDSLPEPVISYTALGAKSFISAGSGGPTVLFESGLGHGKEVWGSIFNDISAVTHAVAYDRAGYGQSEASSQSRDGLQILRELRALLEAEEIKPPYILVGHSLGGTIMKLFARTYPNEVAGVVLVDARHAEFAKRCKQIGVHRLWYEPPSLLFALSPSATRAELAAAPQTMRQARRAGPFPTVPLIVLTQDQAARKWPERLGKVWEASQRNMAKMSRLGRMKVINDSGHNIHHDQPDMVTTAILSVLAAAQYALARGKNKPLSIE